MIISSHLLIVIVHLRCQVKRQCGLVIVTNLVTNATLGVSGAATFAGAMTATSIAATSFSGSSTLHSVGAATFGGTLETTGAVTFGSTGQFGGHVTPSADSTYNLGSTSNRWANIYTGDLHLKNERGNWTIFEEADHLRVRNNLTGKMYKMGLTPLEE